MVVYALQSRVGDGNVHAVGSHLKLMAPQRTDDVLFTDFQLQIGGIVAPTVAFSQMDPDSGSRIRNVPAGNCQEAIGAQESGLKNSQRP
eukprot:COSAG01_NODE_5295_length_4352_cov_7.332236_2_plen_89_part_00